MKILPIASIREADAYTIAHEPLASVDLMERAAHQCYHWFHKHIERSRPVFVFCGMGNNGGDGLALSRILLKTGYRVETFVLKHSNAFSADASENFNRLKSMGKTPQPSVDFPTLLNMPAHAVVVDALFGSGLNKPLKSSPANWVDAMNSLPGTKVAIDIPSGLFADNNAENPVEHIFQADITLTFQCPKLAFMLQGRGDFVGRIEILDIGLHSDYIQKSETKNYFTTDEILSSIIPRKKFDHKGTRGHGLLIAGSKGKMGAAVLAAKAALRTGCGLLTVHVPGIGYHIMQTAVPEAMVSLDHESDTISHIKIPQNFQAAGIGPGLGMGGFTARALLYFFVENNLPMVLDADALNIVSAQNGWAQLPDNTILTPHPGEFRRMVEDWKTPEEMLAKAQTFAQNHRMILVLKGAHTAVCLPNGEVHFNSNGTPAMATGGSGDVLTGILTSLLAQGYQPDVAAKLGVFLHGRAGQRAEAQKGGTITAGDIVEFI